MDPDPLSFVMFIIAASLFGVTVAAEIAFTNIRYAHQLEDETSIPGVQLVHEVLEHPSLLLITVVLMKSLSALLLIGMVLFIVLDTATLTTVLGAVVMAWILLNIARTVIRAIVLRAPMRIATQLALVVRVAVWILSPISRPLVKLSEIISGEDSNLVNETLFLTGEGLRRLIDIDSQQNDIQEAEKQMIAGILDLGETNVREVMVPRIDMVALNVETALQEALDVIISAGHSRIPVYEGSADRIIGVLYAKDLLQCLRNKRTNGPIRELLRPAYFVPASKKIDVLFHELQAQRVHMAIIVDEYGGTAGLVTIEDLLEEIVGEIQDEYDPEEETLVELIGTDMYLVSARISIDTLAELIGIDIEEDNVDTLGGLLSLLAGRVPERGRTVSYKNWQFTILSIDGHRIEKVRVEPELHLPAEVVDTQESLNTVSSHHNSTFTFSISGK